MQLAGEVFIERFFMRTFKHFKIKIVVITLCHNNFPTNSNAFQYFVSDRLQISFFILSKFKRINYLLLPLKSSENRKFSDDFRGN